MPEPAGIAAGWQNWSGKTLQPHALGAEMHVPVPCYNVLAVGIIFKTQQRARRYAAKER
jgi:hypothetical protein